MNKTLQKGTKSNCPKGECPILRLNFKQRIAGNVWAPYNTLHVEEVEQNTEKSKILSSHSASKVQFKWQTKVSKVSDRSNKQFANFPIFNLDGAGV